MLAGAAMTTSATPARPKTATAGLVQMCRQIAAAGARRETALARLGMRRRRSRAGVALPARLRRTPLPAVAGMTTGRPIRTRTGLRHRRTVPGILAVTPPRARGL